MPGGNRGKARPRGERRKRNLPSPPRSPIAVRNERLKILRQGSRTKVSLKVLPMLARRKARPVGGAQGEA
jgi:hypothetical protein